MGKVEGGRLKGKKVKARISSKLEGKLKERGPRIEERGWGRVRLRRFEGMEKRGAGQTGNRGKTEREQEAGFSQ